MPEENNKNPIQDINEAEIKSSLSEEERQAAASALAQGNTQTPQNDQAGKNDLAEKLRKARRAMAGPEKVAEWEKEKQEQEIAAEKNRLQEKLNQIEKQKERLEISWVALDNKRNGLRKILEPILTEEEEVELKEDTLEGQERTTPLAEERQKIEKERWQVQEKRRTLELQKWDLEDKLNKINQTIKENTEDYQALLTKEEEIKKELEEIENEAYLVIEQTRLEEEEKKRQALEQLELEEKRRQAEIKEQAEAKVKAEQEAARAAKVAEAETKKEEEPKIQQSPIKNTEAEDLNSSKSKQEDETKAAEIEAKKKRAEADRQRQAEIQKALELKRKRAEENKIQTPKKPDRPEEEVPTEKISDDLQKIRAEIAKATGQAESPEIETPKPPQPEENENNLPKVRTFQSDAQQISQTNDQAQAELNKQKKKFPWLNN